MWDWLWWLLDDSPFLPRTCCATDGEMPAELVWTYQAASWVIALSYLAIPIILLIVARRLRHHAPAWVLVLFAAFILSCGLGHALDATMFEAPRYRLMAASLVITAVVSIAAAIAVAPAALMIEERSVHRSMAILRAIEASPAGHALVAADGRIIWANEAACALWGRSLSTLQKIAWPDITHPDDIHRDAELVADVLEGRRPSYNLAKRYIRPGGELVAARLTVAATGVDTAPLHACVEELQTISADCLSASEGAAMVAQELREVAERLQQIEQELSEPEEA